MSYYSRVQTGGLLDFLSKGADYAQTLSNTKVLEAAQHILEDPYLPDVTRQVMILHSMEQPGKPGGPPVKGIGLKKVVKPLKFYVELQKNPILKYGLIAALVLVPFAIGRASR